MKKLGITILISLLSGCSPFPIHNACDTPSFRIGNNLSGISYFDSNGYFGKQCPAGVSEKFTYLINDKTNVTIRVRGEWIDLKPLLDGAPFKLKGNEVRELNFEGYTQAVRVDSLVNNTLSFMLPNSDNISINFNVVKCTCVTYDAI